MKFYAIGLAAAILLCSGCGREEKREAIAFGKVLQQKDADMVSANAMEKELRQGTRGWCDNIVANGSGKGAELEQNAASAKVLAQSAAAVSAQLSSLRQLLYDNPLKQEFVQHVRGNILRDLTDRQRRLEDMKKNLEDSAATFLQFQNSREYNGQSYPPGIAKLASVLSNASALTDPLSNGITELKTNYSLTDADLPPPPPSKVTLVVPPKGLV